MLIVNQQLELEQAALTGGAVVDTSHAGYSGRGFVDSHKGQACSQFNVDVMQAGMYELELRYANGTGSVRTLSLVTDQNSEQISLPATANWNSWTSFAHTVYLDVGSHSLSYLFANSDSGNINLDTVGLIQVTSTDPGPDPTEPPVVNPVDGNYYEAENAFLSGGGVSVYINFRLSGHWRSSPKRTN
ncbi:CBM35 domain-containing protein [Pseudoalteromonas sp. HL-AS1]|uniref:CBM35 domain-containing protein n=1 Tax=Pseudoalteromonas sp. HL-AS1 TaxID=3071081 RepID=UPI002814FD9A|nr:carbohydrate-binding protein [Pseudoalteromonas sp. HL-AS1]WMS92279.1 carbohydrate-binding protein [Pseudoalteromonas sp. HL-AS1]